MIGLVIAGLIWYVIGYAGALWVIHLDRDVDGEDAMVLVIGAILGPLVVLMFLAGSEAAKETVIIRRRS